LDFFRVNVSTLKISTLKVDGLINVPAIRLAFFFYESSFSEVFFQNRA